VGLRIFTRTHQVRVLHTNMAQIKNTARTERKILERGLTTRCIQLARLQNRSIAIQEKALHNKPPRCSHRKSYHRRGTKIRDQVFRVPAE